MSELKTYSFPVDHGDFTSTVELFYLKSEADKVIAELEDKCQMHDFFWEGCGFAKRGFKNTIAVSESFDKLEAENAQLKKACNDKDDWCLHTLKENRHQKYKRCLAMANYCYTNVHCIMGHRLCALSDRKKEWFERWHKRWLELAENFKEAK